MQHSEDSMPRAEVLATLRASLVATLDQLSKDDPVRRELATALAAVEDDLRLPRTIPPRKERRAERVQMLTE